MSGGKELFFSRGVQFGFGLHGTDGMVESVGTDPCRLRLPGSLPPIVVYDRNGFRILLHFSQTGAPGHPDVKVLLLTMMSTATQPVWDVMFQVAVPKSMRVKLQPASSSKLPAFSPLMPPAVISQTLLLDNPHKEPIRLRYKLTFNQGGQPFSEVGEVKDFPDLAVLSTA